MKRRVLGSLSVVFLVFAVLLSVDSAHAAETQFSARVLKEVGEPSPKWKEIRFDKVSNSDYRLTLLYKKMPANYREVETDTKRIARAVLKVLISDGRKPQEEWVSVFVHAHKPETGETGAELVRVFGRTFYDFNTDQLKFEPAR